MNRRQEVTQERLKELLEYDQSTGFFTWIKRTSARARLGGIAGYPSKRDGYYRIGIDGINYLAHRLAFLYMLGEWPDTVDHIDGNGSNNCWDNIRDVSHAQNHQNKAVKGYFLRKNGWYMVQLKVNGKHVVSKLVRTEEEAIRLRKESVAKYHPYNERSKVS